MIFLVLDVCVAGASKCRTTEECIVDSTGQDRCQCIDVSNCPSELKPVCGSNGKEYNNKCLMKLKSCSEGKHNTTVVAQGNCAFGKVFSKTAKLISIYQSYSLGHRWSL